LVIYAPYRGVSWSIVFQDSKDRALTTDIPKIMKSLQNSAGVVVEKAKEAERRAEIQRREWEERQEALAAGGRPPSSDRIQQP
jgi:hypothetical protein